MNKLSALVVTSFLVGASVAMAQKGGAVPEAPSSLTPVPAPAFPNWNAPEPTPAEAPSTQESSPEPASQAPVLAPAPEHVPTVPHPDRALEVHLGQASEIPPSNHSSVNVVESAAVIREAAGCPCQQNQSARLPGGYGMNAYGSAGMYETPVPPVTAGLHERYPYYSYRRPWYTPGVVSQNVTIPW